MTQTIDDLLAQRDALDIQIEAAQIIPLTDICEALSDPAITNALAVLNANLPALQGDSQAQAHNVVTILNHCPALLQGRLADILSRQPDPEPEPEA